MAYVYSTVKSFGSSNAYGNVAMDVNIFRGDVTRTETTVSFTFGVSFKPTGYNTSNSIAAWYGGTQKFAYSNSGYEYEDAPVIANSGTTYYAYYVNRDLTRAYTTQNLCFSFSKSSISATTKSVDVSIGVGWKDWAGTNKGTLKFAIDIPEYHGAGSATKPTIKSTGNNEFTISGRTTAGTNNAFEYAKVYYTTDGTTPVESSSTKSDSTKTVGNYVFTFDVPSSSDTSTVKAVVESKFKHNDVISWADATKVYRYKNGGAPTINTLSDNGNNTFKIKVTLPNDTWNNKLESAVLYYTTDGTTPSTSITSTTSTAKRKVNIFSTGAGKTYTGNFPIPSATKGTVKALIRCGWSWSGQSPAVTSNTKDATIQYHTDIDISPVKVQIIDNGNNTFTVTGTPAEDGTNNVAATTYAWGYTSACSNAAPVNSEALDIAKESDTTRTVYAKAIARPSWIYDSNYKSGNGYTYSTNAAIKQYVAPGSSGIPTLTAASYRNGRLCLRNGEGNNRWEFTWAAATKTNNAADTVYYRVALERNGVTITWKDWNDSSVGSSQTATNSSWLSFDTTSTSIKIDPVNSGFVPGDTVRLRVKSYIRNGKNQIVASSTYINSERYTVENTGVVRIKAGGAWKEGQVWVKVNGTWKEAQTVNIKVNGSWKESQ